MEKMFTDFELAMFTPDLNIKRYLDSDIVDRFDVWTMATLTYPNGYNHDPRIHNESIALTTNQKPVVKVKEKDEVRIRKLVPCEVCRLMGFTKEDYLAMRNIGMADSQIWHCCGDSIVVSVLCMILGKLLPISDNQLKEITENYIEKVKE